MPSMKLSPREQLLVMVVGISVMVFVLWTFLIEPKIESISKTTMEIASVRTMINEAELRMKNPRYAGQAKFNPSIFNKETQLSYSVDFIYGAFRKQDIKLSSMTLTSGGNKIVLDMQFKCSYSDLMTFLNSLKELNTYYVVDSFYVTQEKRALKVNMKFTTVYI